MRWRSGPVAGDPSRTAAALHAPLPPPLYAPSTSRPALSRAYKLLLVAATACVAAVLYMWLVYWPWLEASCYGGLVGRTWTVSQALRGSPSDLVLAWPRFAASNYAGLEEEGWMADAVAETVTKTNGAGCVAALTHRPGSSDSSGGFTSSRDGLDGGKDFEACPCLVNREGGALRPPSPSAAISTSNNPRNSENSSSSQHGVPIDAPRPVFYLKLHKVGSTTITSALLMRCLEQELQRRSQSLSSAYPSIHAAQVAFLELKGQQKSSKSATSASSLASRRAAYAKVDRVYAQLAAPSSAGGRSSDASSSISSSSISSSSDFALSGAAHSTPPSSLLVGPLEACRRAPMRISHNTLQAYLKAGTCAAAQDIGACLQKNKKNSDSSDNSSDNDDESAISARVKEKDYDDVSRGRQGHTLRSGGFSSESRSRSSMMVTPAFHPPNHFLRAAKAAATNGINHENATVRAEVLPHNGNAAALSVVNSTRSPLLSRPQTPPLNRALMLVVLRRPVDRFVSSLYFWNCERATFPKAKALLLRAPPMNMTAKTLAKIVSGIGRIDVDEPLHVLSRGQYRADRTALATAAVNLATNRKAGASNGASNAAATGATAPDLQLGHRTGLETTKTAPEVLLNAGNSPGGIGSEMTNFMGSFSRNRAAAAAARAKGLRVALQNLKSDFDVVGVMEEMDAFLTLVALAMHWAPSSLAYRPVRVRENAFKERRSHDATMDYNNKEEVLASAAAAAAATTRSSTGTRSRGGASSSIDYRSSTGGRRRRSLQKTERQSPGPTGSESTASSSSAKSARPVGGQCSVRARHLSTEALSAVQAMVQDEEVLYAAALRRSRHDAALSGVAFTEGVKSLAVANAQLMHCTETSERRFTAEARAHAALGA